MKELEEYIKLYEEKNNCSVVSVIVPNNDEDAVIITPWGEDSMAVFFEDLAMAYKDKVVRIE